MNNGMIVIDTIKDSILSSSSRVISPRFIGTHKKKQKSFSSPVQESNLNGPIRNESRRLLTAKAAVTYLSMPIGTLYNKVSARKIRVVRIDRRLRFDINDLDAIIEDRKDKDRNGKN